MIVDEDVDENTMFFAWSKNVKMVNYEVLTSIIKHKVTLSVTATDKFHIRKMDELIKDNQQILQRDIAVKL